MSPSFASALTVMCCPMGSPSCCSGCGSANLHHHAQVFTPSSIKVASVRGDESGFVETYQLRSASQAGRVGARLADVS